MARDIMAALKNLFLDDGLSERSEFELAELKKATLPNPWDYQAVVQALAKG